MHTLILALLLVLPPAVASDSHAQSEERDFSALVFSKTAGFRHSSIPDGVAALQRLGEANDFHVDATEESDAFTPENLANYEAVIFLNTTGDVLNDAQEEALSTWLESGRGLVGIHSAADTEYEWEWYGHAMGGGYFRSHPQIQEAVIHVEDHTHPSTAHLPAAWTRTDEWYDYRQNPRGDAHVLMTLDENTYEGGRMGDDHPIAWLQQVGNGRIWYTGSGHTEESYTEPHFLEHVLGGILWAAGRAGDETGAVGARETQSARAETIAGGFQKVVLNDDAVSPLELAVANDGRVFFIERAGDVRIWHPDTGQTSRAGFIPVRVTGENGMLGLALDPAFDDNGWVYLFHTVPDGAPRQHVSRFTVVGDQLDMNSQKVLLEVPLTLGECCHSGGGLEFGPDGTLYIGLGDETNPFESDGFAPIDEREGREIWDAQRTAANTNDLRGKILRIRPLDDGTYEIPEGNLFPADGSEGLPEIYVMGNRNPFRFSIDSETGWLYWGEVGPDAGDFDETRGPAGHDEINQARRPGNFGWPYVAGNNMAYHAFDFESGVPGSVFDPANLANASPNNTGARVLPPAEPAFIWYPYGPSDQFPELEAGGRTAIAGPVYRHNPETAHRNALPASLDGALFFADWQRSMILFARMNAAGDLETIHRFQPSMQILRPIDLEVGPEGRLYVIEWGTEYRGSNPDARIVRLDYHGNPTAHRNR